MALDAVYEADVNFDTKTATVKIVKGTTPDEVIAGVSGQFSAKLKG